MRTLIADSGSTKTHWAWVDQQSGLPKFVRTATTQGLNPLYVTPQQITEALRQVLSEFGVARVGEGPDELHFFGSGCSGQRIQLVEQALRASLSPMTRVSVESDLVGASVALSGRGLSPLPLRKSLSVHPPFIAGILGTGAIAALYQPDSHHLQPMPALGYILGDEGSGAWFGRHLLSDYLKDQMPSRAREAFEDDFGVITPESAIQHVYQQPCPNRYLATFAAFLCRHQALPYAQQLAYRGIDAFWRRNVMPIDQTDLGADIRDVRLVGSVAYHLRPIIEAVAESHGYLVTQVLKDPIEGMI